MGQQPKYPVFIPSKGRAAKCHTAAMFLKDGVPFKIVVEPSQEADYTKVWGSERVLVMDKDGGGLVYARNWITDYSRNAGDARHWQFDDDIKTMVRLHLARRLPCAANVALVAMEAFVDQYENIGLASFNSEFFVPANLVTAQKWPPFYHNARCYTCFLFMNSMPNRWRGPYNEDTDMSLQVLSSGLCTILINAFCMRTAATMTMSGGQTDIYVGDGRLKMSRNLERRWPGVITTYRRFGRAQHKVAMFWKQFSTPLIRKADADRPDDNNFGLRLVQKREIKTQELRDLVTEVNKND